MSNQIMKESTLLSLQMSLIDKTCYEQFVVGILGWYRDYVPVGFSEHEILSEVPNLFHITEYPTAQGEDLINLIIESDVRRTIREAIANGRDYEHESVERYCIQTFEENFPDIYGHILHDCRVVLDAYHLFYCFQDDAQVSAKYFNPYVKEVW